MIEEIIDVSRDAKLIKTAVGGDAKSIAFKYGKHVSWVKRQYNTEYPNFWTVTKRWIHAFAKVNIDKAELFFKDFELLKNTLYTEVKKIPTENIVLIEKDVAQYFQTSESVNEALRFLIRITKQHQSELNNK